MPSNEKDIITKDVLTHLKNKKNKLAFEAIVLAYNQKIYWHARSILQNHEDANDVTQNTFVKVWKALPNFKGDSKVFTWIYRIATNESLSFISNKNRTILSTNNESFELSTTQDAIKMDANEIEQRLALAISRLPEKQRIVFNLKYYEELSYQEISEITETSIGALKASYHHAVKKIEKSLTSH